MCLPSGGRGMRRLADWSPCAFSQTSGAPASNPGIKIYTRIHRKRESPKRTGPACRFSRWLQNERPYSESSPHRSEARVSYFSEMRTQPRPFGAAARADGQNALEAGPPEPAPLNSRVSDTNLRRDLRASCRAGSRAGPDPARRADPVLDRPSRHSFRRSRNAVPCRSVG